MIVLQCDLNLNQELCLSKQALSRLSSATFSLFLFLVSVPEEYPDISGSLPGKILSQKE